ncbi:methyltransferase domain protein [Ancylostoma ceylanicum]|uniref:Methyltransferase domain protein n=1 Tax=Ancylostoma ceylanicum TaxID=53326 RepID=A0A0D6LU74_9BILA|nr:methyltransferase domain protein [Ancylostoma ceylanicum]
MAEKSDFQKRLMQIGIDGVLSASIAVGNRLQLFHALAKVGSEDKPATPAQVAEESGCKERYVKEWLSVMATGDLITVTEDEKFFIKKENIAERLEQGGMMCLDVGCGKGFHAVLLAQNFPKSNFTGIDVTLEAVHLANQQRKDNGETFDNLAFIQMDGAKMDPDWTEKFDLVTIFDACHDQMRPDLCLKEIYRVLKPGDALGLGAMWGQERALKMLKDAGFSNARIVATPFYEGSTLYVSTKD